MEDFIYMFTLDGIIETTWAELKAFPQRVKTGNYIPFALKNEEEIAVRAMHDGTGKLFFVLENCFGDKRRINLMDNNVGGWQTCEMRHYLNGYVFPLLPDDLQKAIVQTEIAESGPRGGETTSKDKLFLLSLEQVCGADFDQLDWFEEKRHRIKLDDKGKPSDWWLRSTSAKNLFDGVSSSGNPTIYDIDTLRADFDQLDWFEAKEHRIRLDGKGEPSDWWLRSASAKNLFDGVSSSGNPTIYDIDTLRGVAFGFCLTD